MAFCASDSPPSATTVRRYIWTSIERWRNHWVFRSTTFLDAADLPGIDLRKSVQQIQPGLQVRVQAEADYSSRTGRHANLNVMNRTGQMVPLGALIAVHQDAGLGTGHALQSLSRGDRDRNSDA